MISRASRPAGAPRPRRPVGESLLILGVGLFIGCGLATLFLAGGWLLLAGQPAAATRPPSPPSDTPAPSATPLPTIPVQIIPAPQLAGGTIATTTGGIKFTLATGATIFVGPETEVELTQLPSAEAQSQQTVLTLLRGRLLVDVVLQPGDSFQIRTPTQDQAEVVGSLMGVEYNPETQVVRVDCLEGHCRLGRLPDTATGAPSVTPVVAVELADGQSSFQSPESPPSPPDENTRNEEWQALGGEIVPPPDTPTPEPTLDRPALCATFAAQFPGTPCP